MFFLRLTKHLYEKPQPRKNKEKGEKGKEEEGEKKRVDVKETRNLAMNKGREKKDGRKTTLLSSPSPRSRGGDGDGESVGFSSDRQHQRRPAFVG